MTLKGEPMLDELRENVMEEKIEMPKDPNFGSSGYGTHVFNPSCDIMGGSAFRHWCSLFYHKGVFIGYDNHNWVVWVSSDPTAVWRRGCQNSAAYGDPYPTSEGGKMLRWRQCPKEVQEKALPLVLEAIDICQDRVEKHLERKKEAADQRVIEAKQKEEAIVRAWGEVEEG